MSHISDSHGQILAFHQQPEASYLPRFSSQLISLERYTLSVYRAGEIDLFENLDIVHIRLLVVDFRSKSLTPFELLHVRAEAAPSDSLLVK